jgi:hypothetical protein
MPEEEYNVIDAIWFNNIGIVKVDTGYGLKWYIGNGSGENAEYDKQYIAKYGIPVYPGVVKQFFNYE